MEEQNHNPTQNSNNSNINKPTSSSFSFFKHKQHATKLTATPTNQPPAKSTKTKKKKLNKWFNFKSWIDADGLRTSYSSLENIVIGCKRILLGQNSLTSGANAAPAYPSFDAMMQTIGTSAEEIARYQTWFKRSSWFYLVMSLLTGLYVIYLWRQAGWILGLLSTSFTLFLATMACRERKHYYQLANRLISCSMKDWLAALLRGQG